MERSEAIEIVRKNWPDSGYSQLREALKTLVPELKENEASEKLYLHPTAKGKVGQIG